ncbi:MAG: DUF4838 domain-containing protein [Planctomycetes bacterium]|nr:DUF4838 domain-containing protein [Planctomycetota bacterium]
MQMSVVIAALVLAVAGAVPAADLVIAENGKATATIVASAKAGPAEKAAVDELVRVITVMTGATVPVAEKAGKGPTIFVGSAALDALPALKGAMAKVAKKNPMLRADAIAMRRDGDKVYLAGNNDEAHSYAVMQLLHDWGCRWYLPTAFGECIPDRPKLVIGALDRTYASPFEIRGYWLSWNGDGTGSAEFQRHNFMSSAGVAGGGHALGQYTKDVVPPGKGPFNIALSEDATAASVASKIEEQYAQGVPSISLAIEDGNYTSDSARDKQLQAGIWDKYALQPANTDPMMALYNNVAKILRAKHPNSPTKIGGMAYANVTLPPQQVTAIEPNLVMWLAPIDIDPNHGMDDANSPPRQEYKEMMYRWSKLVGGRLAIYDYDQGQLVWRDLPNPSHMAFAQDVKHYRDAGILGVATESRGAMATTFLNLHIRGQLLWNPEANVGEMLADFYPAFYGPAAKPMAAYWSAIFNAWTQTVCTEHEYFVAPAIYTPELVAALKGHLAEALAAVEPLKGATGRNDKLYLERMTFTRLGFEVIESYMAMVEAAAAKNDYQAAVVAGERGLAARDQLTDINGTFTTYRKIGEGGSAWWPGEVQHMRDLAAMTDGTKGTLVAATPLQWSFRTDAHDTGLARGWYLEDIGTDAKAATAWQPLRTDLYMQGQGIRHADQQSYTGHYWYQTAVDLTAEQISGDVHLLFPGVFNDGWLYVNGQLVAHRGYKEPWWLNDYKFEWDLAVGPLLKPGRNVITLRGLCTHHFGGIFRRPFLYRPAAK